MFFQKFKLNSKDLIYLTLVSIFSSLIIYKLIEWYNYCGIFDPDKAIYLMDALKFAGMDYYNICPPENIYYSPVICYLTSIVFRLGLVDKLAIFIVTGIFGVICEIGIYILFRNKFNSLLSFTGVIIFGSLSVVLWNIGSGGIDIPSLAISVWIIIFTIIAVEKNPKFFIIVFPLLVLGFFTRYTVGFILPVITIYYAINRNIIDLIDCFISNRVKFKEKVSNYLKSDEFKYICISIFLAIILTTIICLFILNNGGSLSFLQMSTSTFNGAKANPKGVDYSLSRLFYLKKLPEILFQEDRFLDSTTAYSLLIILISGCLLKLINNLKIFKTNKINFKTKNFDVILKILLSINIIGIIFGFAIIRNHMISNICLIITLIIAYTLYSNKDNNFKFTLLNLSWFALTFIFASLYTTKTERYALPFIIPFIYFIILGFEEILNRLKNNFSNKTIKIIPIILILFLLYSNFIFIDFTIPEKNSELGIGIQNVTEYIKKHDSNYHFKKMIANEHFFSTVKWYLEMNGTYLRDYEIKTADNINASYLIINQDTKFKNYHEIYSSSDGVRLLVPN